jgi:peptidoglycan/LPS O-acetylase OafA/YrhL
MESPADGPGRRHVPELDGFRAVAIGVVMVYHFWAYAGSGAVGQALTKLAGVGWCGVDVFFVLSGFLITGILLDGKDAPHAWRRFYARRTLRIFPLYYAVLTMLVLAVLGSRALGWRSHDTGFERIDRIWVNCVYLSNFAMAFKGSDWVPFDITWSLAVEEQFYLVYPLIVAGLVVRRLPYFLAAAVLLAPVARGLSVTLTGNALAAYALPFCRMDQLAFGGLACLVLRGGRATILAWIRTAAPVLCAAALAFLFLWTRWDRPFIWAGYSLTGAASAAVLVTVLGGRWTWLASLLRFGPLVWMGKVSYGLYLLHLFARAIVNQGLLKDSLSRTSLAAEGLRLVVLFAVALVMAGVSWLILERPVLKLRDRLPWAA